jgi:hypothetical protein
MIYSIALFPKGRSVENTPAVYFPDMETKEKYVEKEVKFCLKAYNKYLTSLPNDRKGACQDFDDKRILFAKQQNYAPKKGNKLMWVLQESAGGDGDNPKRYA